MTQYIDKSALVAEIERLKGIRKKETYLSHYALSGYLCACVDILSFLDTLEVKEVEEEHYNMIDAGSYTTTTKAQKGK